MNKQTAGFAAWRRRLPSALAASLALCFGLIAAAPLEICAGNTADLAYGPRRIAWLFILLALAAGVLLACLISLFRRKNYSFALCLVAGLALACWAQSLFLNGRLAQLDGADQPWKADIIFIFFNALIFILITSIPFLLRRLVRTGWRRIVALLCAALLLMQGAGSLSLILSDTRSSASDYYYIPDSSAWKLASDENIIVLILDSFNNSNLDAALAEWPDALSDFHDFTYYRNCGQVYSFTKPALMSLLTGLPVDVRLNWTERFRTLWSDGRVQDFYASLAEAGWSRMLYTGPDHICDSETGSLVQPCFENLKVGAWDARIVRRQAVRQYACLSLWRCLPYALKLLVPVENADLSATAVMGSDLADPIYHEAYFTQKQIASVSVEQGVNKRLTIYHTLGTHLPMHLDEHGVYDKNINTTEAQVGRGTLQQALDFIARVRDLDLYGRATIIIMADHGRAEYGSYAPVFMVKRAGETHDIIQTRRTPITVNDMPATVAAAAGLDPARFGLPVWDIPEDLPRERRSWRSRQVGGLASYNRGNAFDECLIPDDANDFEHYFDNFVQRIFVEQ